MGTALRVGLIVGGGAILVSGALALALDRLAPSLAAAAPWLPRAGAAGLLIGNGLLALGLVATVFGWENGRLRRRVTHGSHRSVIGSVAFALLLTSVAQAGYAAVAADTGLRSAATFLVLAVTLDVAFLLVLYAQAIRPGIVSIASLGLTPALWRRGIWWGLAGAVALMTVSLLNNLVLLLLGLEQPQAEALAWIRELPPAHFFAIAVAGAIAAPVLEEVFFRGYVFRAYLAEKGPVTAYVATSLIFGLVHGQPILLGAFFVMGVILAYLYRRTGTIVTPVVSHMLNNSLAFASLLTFPAP